MPASNPFGAEGRLAARGGDFTIYRLRKLADDRIGDIDTLPYSIRVLLEACLRKVDNYIVSEQDVRELAAWNAAAPKQVEVPFLCGRVVLQDLTGVPAVVDLAALRSAMVRMGGDPKKINPLVPCDLVVDHSVQVDFFATADAYQKNVDVEFERNEERYRFLRWGQKAFRNFRVVPPAIGIVHQVNLEYLAKVVLTKDGVAFPDSLVGTDSHTTMINGLGVVGWGVGGIEAEAVMLGQPIYMLTPEVVGFKLTGSLPEGATATDLVLTVTQMLRKHKVVGKFVEFYGAGLSSMSLPDRATLANMAPEYGATMGFFPVDNETLRYLRRTGRTEDEVDLVERYYKEQGMFRTDASPDPRFTSTLSLDLSTVGPSMAGPKRPQDRILVKDMKTQWHSDWAFTFGRANDDVKALSARVTAGQESTANLQTELDRVIQGAKTGEVRWNGHADTIRDGSVVMAAITSCTNTSNPSVLIGAGLLAKKAVEKGLSRKPWVKTSLAPGSRVVTDYLHQAGLDKPLDALGFNLVGYGCTTCIGNGGPLPEPVSKTVADNDLIVAAVLSGNRNFEGRINPQVKAMYLASPPLCVAYALAGTVDIDFETEPLGHDRQEKPVFLRDIWPCQKEIADTIAASMSPRMFVDQYAKAADGPPEWQKIPVSGGELFEWDSHSTYVQEPPFFVNMPREPRPIQPIHGARCLVSVGDSVTTDHISPAGSIKPTSSAGKYLQELGVKPIDFNSYGARRGNDRVMTRGTFANIRLRNLLVPDSEGPVTVYFGAGEDQPQMSIYDASIRYKTDGTPLVALAGSEYGTGSSRDWAAKGTYLLGIRAVIAVSFERIHRSNLVGMGVLPLEFRPGESREALGLDGTETFDIALDDRVKPRQAVEVTAIRPDGTEIRFTTLCRIDTPVEVEYYRHGGILHKVLRDLAKT